MVVASSIGVLRTAGGCVRPHSQTPSRSVTATAAKSPQLGRRIGPASGSWAPAAAALPRRRGRYDLAPRAAAAPPPAGKARGSGKSVVVVGGGVVGLSAALKLTQQFPGMSVTVIADKYGSDTTSHGSGGWWMPYVLNDTPTDKVLKWGAATFEHYLRLVNSSEAPASGVQLINSVNMWRQREPLPFWKDVVLNFTEMDDDELSKLGVSDEFRYGWTFTSIVADQSYHLPWLMGKLEAAGVALRTAKVESLFELIDYDCVINCAGLGAADLVGDGDIGPVRGQVLRVDAPWVKLVWGIDHDGYIIPQLGEVVLGGTRDPGVWDTEPSAKDTKHIMDAVCSAVPSIREAPVVSEWVGLRPSRSALRLELSLVEVAEDEFLPVVHNYGHGGSGVTLAWGCAVDAANKVAQALQL